MPFVDNLNCATDPLMPNGADAIMRAMHLDQARAAGANCAEEVEKFIAATQKLNERNWKNCRIKFEGTGDQRKLVTIIGLYTNPNQTRKFDDVPDYAKLQEEGLEVDTDGDIDISEMVGVCEHCGEKLNVEKLEHIVDVDEMWCRGCCNDCAHKCERCGNWYESSDEFEEVYRDYDSYLGYWCNDCQREEHAWWSEDDERMYINPGGAMQKFYKPEGLLAQGVHGCPDCQDAPEGWCPRHLKMKIQEIEDEATHLWIYDTGRRDYHTREHARFKQCKYRTEHEHPYLYYGIEWEALWDGRKGSREKVVKEFIEATGGMFVAEYDRSVDERGSMLGNYVGAEFISRPTSYKRWIHPDTIAALNRGAEVLKKYGAIDPQDDGCGLHVHMSKAFFEKNTKKKVKDIKSDMDWFFQFFQPEIEIISRRKYTQYCASKAFRMQNAVNDFRNNNAMFGVKGKFQMEKGQLTVSQGSGITHHDCVIETPKTIEARTFRSTVDPKDILATIEFCRGLAHAARNRTGLTGRSFSDIMFTKDCKYLDEYVRKLKMDTSRVLKTKLEVKI